MSRVVNTILLGPPSLLREGVDFTISRTRYKVTAASDTLSAITLEAWSLHQHPSLTIILTADPTLIDAIDTVRTLRERRPLECIVVLSESVGRDEEGLLQAGANACIASSVSPDVFVMSLNLLLAKEIAMAALTDRLNSAFTAVDTHQPSRPLSLGDLGSAGTRGLTRRELDVLQAVARGESNKRIANRLSMREPTVKSHMRVILKKIGSNNRTQAATWAVSHGLADQAAAHLPGSETSLNGYSRQDGSYLNTA